MTKFHFVHLKLLVLVRLYLAYCLLTICEETGASSRSPPAPPPEYEELTEKEDIIRTFNNSVIAISRLAPTKREQDFLFRVLEPVLSFNISRYRLPSLKPSSSPYHSSHVYCARCRRRRPPVLPPKGAATLLRGSEIYDEAEFRYVKGKVERNFRLEIFKEEILERLGLDERPSINETRRKEFVVPTPITETLWTKSEREQNGLDNFDDDPQPVQTVVFMDGDSGWQCSEQELSRMAGYISKDVDYVKRDSLCLSFRISSKIKLETVSSIKMWLYVTGKKIKNGTQHSFHIIDIGNENYRSIGYYSTFDIGGNHVKSPPITGEGWITVDTYLDFYIDEYKKKRRPGIVESESEEDSIIRLAFITTPTYCNYQSRCRQKLRPTLALEGGSRPFMIIKHRPSPAHGLSQRKRVKRSKVTGKGIDRNQNICTRHSKDCCRKKFFVSFEDIGWHDWIIEPEGYQPNYCVGSCEKFIVPRYEHTSVIRAVYHYYPDLVQELMPCCAPSQMSSISMLYFDNEGNIHKTELKNMIIESCGCS